MRITEGIRLWRTNEGYIRYNDTIQHIVVNKITIVPNEDAENANEQKIFKIDCIIGGSAMEIEYNYLPCLYSNEEDCKNEKNNISTRWWRSETHDRCIRYFWNSRAMKVQSVLRGELIRELTFNGFWVEKIIDNRELFEDKNKCKCAQDILITEPDGSTRINKGLRSRLALNDKQKELLAKYEDICNQLKDANVQMILADNKTYAYNTAEIEYLTACYSYGDLYDNEYEGCEVSDFCTQVKNFVSMGGWDNGLYVKLPKNEKD